MTRKVQVMNSPGRQSDDSPDDLSRNRTENSERSTMLRLIQYVSLIALLTLTAVACGAPSPTIVAGPSTAGAKSYIAKVEGASASARVGIVVEANKFVAYVCSLDDAFNLSTSRWYKGNLDANGNVQGTSPDGVEFKGTVSGDRFTGTLVNTAKKSMAFNGSLVPTDGKTGLYRGAGKYGGVDVVVGSVLDPDGTFAATVQKKDKIEFVSPVASPPNRLSADSLGIKIGTGEQITVNLVKTLQGPDLF
jgi:hypothetical protein